MKKTNLSEYNAAAVPDGKEYRIAVIAAEWNPEVTDAMMQGAIDTLRENGVKDENILKYRVPGTFELTTAAEQLLKRTFVDAVICIGCILSSYAKLCHKDLPTWR